MDNPESSTALPVASAPLDPAVTSMSDHITLEQRVTTQEQKVLDLTALLAQSEQILQDEKTATDQRFAELAASLGKKN